MKKLLIAALLGISFPAVSFGAPTPDLYPNQKLKTVSRAQSDLDIRNCEAETESYVSSRGEAQKDRKVLKGAARGTAMGALGGAIVGGKAGRGAGAGAAIGGLNAGLDSRKERKDQEKNGTPEYRKFMETCLEDKGYRVAGWH